MRIQLLFGICFELHNPREPEVTNLDGAVLVDKDVGGFDVPMHNISRVHIIHGAQEVIHYGNNVIFSDLNIVLQHFAEINISVLHHDQDISELGWVGY